jgi:hypothetical protein
MNENIGNIREAITYLMLDFSGKTMRLFGAQIRVNQDVQIGKIICP